MGLTPGSPKRGSVGRRMSQTSLTPLTPYQWKLLGFLSVATFFEGFDFMALSQILPNMREEMQLSIAQAGVLLSVINIGTLVAYVLIRKADAWGRRRVLMVTILGYTLFTGLTAIAPGPVFFTIVQFLARLFLIAEWATAMVYVAEEYPADRRGMVMGVMQGVASLGSIVCAGVVPLLLKLDLGVAGFELSGWRNVYVAGILPLLLLAFARRGLSETKRFEQSKLEQRSGPVRVESSKLAIMRGPYRRRVLQLGLIWSLTYFGMANAVTFWKDFAVNERGFTDGEVGAALTIASIVSMPLVFGSGRLLDVIGRRRGAVVIFGVGIAGVFLSFTLWDPLALQIAVIFGIFGVSAVLPVLNSLTTELFPTTLRSDAFSWSNNLLGRIGYVLGPVTAGWIGTSFTLGTAVAGMTVAPLIALGLLMVWVPETSNRELEDTAKLG
jgi:putative MFS transporter